MIKINPQLQNKNKIELNEANFPNLFVENKLSKNFWYTYDKENNLIIETILNKEEIIKEINKI